MAKNKEKIQVLTTQEKASLYKKWMDEELTQLDSTLTQTLPDDMTEASITNDAKSRARLLSALVENPQFKPYQTFGDSEYANHLSRIC